MEAYYQNDLALGLCTHLGKHKDSFINREEK
jgi:hypothetical protein